MQKNTKQKVRYYFDGFNFYRGLRSIEWKKYYWLDIVKFCKNWLKPYQELSKVKYFSSPHWDEVKAKRQNIFFSANCENDKFKLILGKFVMRPKLIDGKIINFRQEKKTDVAIASEMITDVANHKCDISILVSGDIDLIPAIKAIKKLKPDHKIFVYFPPNRSAWEIKRLSGKEIIKYVQLERHQNKFESSMFPDEVELKNGIKLFRPDKWK